MDNHAATTPPSSSVVPPVAGKPLILLIHGAWHTPEHYYRLTTALEKAGFPVLCPALPSCNDASPPDKNLDDDVLFIRPIAQSAVSQGHDVVALMHSYGGIVGSNALAGLKKLKALVYMAAFIPMEGESLAGIFGGTLPPWLISNEKTAFIDIVNPEGMFYGDLPEEEQKMWAGKLVRHGIECQYEWIRREHVKRETGGKVAWKDEGAKVCYLVCTQDAALPDWVQRMMIGRIEEQGGLGKGRVGVWEVESSHSAMLKCPERVVECVEDIVAQC